MDIFFAADLHPMEGVSVIPKLPIYVVSWREKNFELLIVSHEPIIWIPSDGWLENQYNLALISCALYG